MARSADRPAAAFEDFVDEDGGITQDAAIDWMMDAHGRSEADAILQLMDVWASGKVRSRTRRWDGFETWAFVETSEDGAVDRYSGEPVDLAPCRRDKAPRRELPSQEEPNEALLEGCFVYDLRMHADDLRWQIEQQLGKPKAAPSKAGRGRPEAPYWPRAHKFIDDWLEQWGCPQPGDADQAKLEGEVADFLAKCTEEPPAESTIRAHVVKRIAERKKQSGLKEADKADK